MTFPMMISKGRVLLWSVAFVLTLTAPAHAANFTGPVVSVLDGDTIEVLHNQHPERIRLSGIDCPEKGQAYGNNAKHAASRLVFGKEVTLQTHDKDKYGPSTTRPSACWDRFRRPFPFQSSAFASRCRSGRGDVDARTVEMLRAK